MFLKLECEFQCKDNEVVKEESYGGVDPSRVIFPG
jgi:hypothetical protein